jgi:ABC-type glutathione transport system ATPase component
MTPPPLLEIQQVSVEFPGRGGAPVRAVNDVTLQLEGASSLGIVGGSGCGKTTLARIIMALIKPDRGHVRVLGRDLQAMSPASLRRHRRHFQMVFQDPGGSLQSRMRAVDLVAEPLIVHGLASRREAALQARACLQSVGIDAAACDRYPHQFSGGQRQRIAVARAVVMQPDLLVCDEPTSALDVSIQTQVLDLLRTLKHTHGFGMILITHDMGVIRQMCDEVCVMEAGHIVELGPVDEVFGSPASEATQRLIAAV